MNINNEIKVNNVPLGDIQALTQYNNDRVNTIELEEVSVSDLNDMVTNNKNQKVLLPSLSSEVIEYLGWNEGPVLVENFNSGDNTSYYAMQRFTNYSNGEVKIRFGDNSTPFSTSTYLYPVYKSTVKIWSGTCTPNTSESVTTNRIVLNGIDIYKTFKFLLLRTKDSSADNPSKNFVLVPIIPYVNSIRGMATYASSDKIEIISITGNWIVEEDTQYIRVTYLRDLTLKASTAIGSGSQNRVVEVWGIF